MSDYLSRVAERASGAPAAVRPLLPSLFDPETAFGNLAPEFAETTAAAPEAPAPRDPRPKQLQDDISLVHKRLAARKTLPPKSAKASPRQDEGDASEISVRSISASDVEPKPVGKKSRAPQVSFETEHVPPKTPLREEPKSSHDEPSRRRAPVVPARTETFPAKPDLERIAADADVPQQRPRTETVSKPMLEPMKARAPASTKARTEKPATVPDHEQPAAPALIPMARQRSSRPSGPAREILALAKESSAARTIRVTIGRIEVRAVQPAPAPAPRRPVRPAPKMSLDDYLRSRNGGGK